MYTDCSIPSPTKCIKIWMRSHLPHRLLNPQSYQMHQDLDAFSPSGGKWVYSRATDAGFSIFVQGSGGQLSEQVVSRPGPNFQASWSPDGAHIAYVSMEDTGSAIWIHDLATKSDWKLTGSDGSSNRHPSWSPSGEEIVYWSDRDGSLQLYVASANGDGSSSLGPDGIEAWNPVWIKETPQEANAVDSDSSRALALGLEVDDGLCRAAIEAVDVSGDAPLTHVLVAAGGEVLHDSGPIEARAYNTIVWLPGEAASPEVVVQVWNTGAFADSPKQVEREQHCSLVVPTRVAAPRETVLATPRASTTPATSPAMVIISPFPEPADVFAAATVAVESTREARSRGTATPIPPNVVTATYTPAPVLVTATVTPANEATREYRHLWATAAAVSTGTTTPLPEWYVVITTTPTVTPTPEPTSTPVPTDTPIPTNTPIPTATPVPTNTPLPTSTPLVAPWTTPEPGTWYVEPTPPSTIPESLKGKILFLSEREGAYWGQVFAVNPDGTELGLLADSWPYELALEQEKFGGDGKYQAYVKEDGSGPQIFFHDFEFNLDIQVTVIGAGASWDPAFDLSGWRIAFVSNEADNDEIYIINRDGSDLRRITKNTWEWDSHPSWSTDGSELVFWSNRSGKRQLYIVSDDGQGLHSISDGTGNDWDPVWVK